jgi:hypothetical protein
MAMDVSAEPAVVRLTRKAARRIAGQTRLPKSRNAVSAMPAGIQTGLALAWMKAR